MTTEIVDIPETLPLNPFPHVDDPEESYNADAYTVGQQLPPAIDRVREIAEAGRKNSLSAKADAQAAQKMAESAEDVVSYIGEWEFLSGSLSVPSTVSYSGVLYTATRSIADVSIEIPGASTAWRPVGLYSQIGAVFTGIYKPGGGWLESGRVFLQSSYPRLFDKIGLRLEYGDARALGFTLTTPLPSSTTGICDDGLGNVLVVTAGNTNKYRLSESGTTTLVEKAFPSISSGNWMCTGGDGVFLAKHNTNKIYKSTDGGLSFSEITVPASFTKIKFNGGVFFGFADGLYVSLDKGDTWMHAYSAAVSEATYDRGVCVIATSGLIKQSSDFSVWTDVASLPHPVNSVIYLESGKLLASGNGMSSLIEGGIIERTSLLPTASLSSSRIERAGNLVAMHSSELLASLDGINFAKVLTSSGQNVLQISCIRGGLWILTISSSSSISSVASLTITYDINTQFKIPRTSLDAQISEWMKAA